MRILNTLQYKQFGGLEKLSILLCNELCKEHEIYFLSDLAIRDYLSKEIKFINFSFNKNRYNPFFLKKTANMIDEISPDILQTHNIKELQILNYARKFSKQKPPIVNTKHSLERKKYLNLADLVVGVSSGVYETIQVDKKILIENGYPFIAPKKIARPDKFYITFANRICDAKGAMLLIEALNLVKFDYECHFFGSGDSKIYEEKVKNLGLQDKIKFKGFVKNIGDYLYSCDLNVMPSLDEAFGLSSLDGVFYAPLMIATRRGICETIMPNELIIEENPQFIARKLDEIHENYDKFVEIFAPIKAKKDEFSVEKMAQNYINAYENLIKDFKK